MEFLKLLEILLRRKWLFAAAFLIFLVVVVAATHLVTPTYEAKAKLLIGSSDVISSLIMSLGIEGAGRSTTASTGDSGAEYQTDEVLATARPLLEKLISSLQLKDRDGDPITPERLVKSNILNLILPRPYVEADQYEDSDILELASFSTDISEAVRMSDTLASVFIEDKLRRTRAEYSAARQFVESQVHEVQKEYHKSLSELKDYRIREKTIDLDVETTKLVDRIDNLKTLYDDNDTRIFDARNNIASAEKQLKGRDTFRKESKGFAQNAQLNSLKTQLNDLLVSIEESGLVITKAHPEYQKLEKDIETVRKLMQNEAELVVDSERFGIDPTYDDLSQGIVDDLITVEVCSAKRTLIQKYIDAYQAELMELPLQYLDYNKIELNLSVKKTMYANLLEYLTQIAIAESMTLSNIRVVEPAAEPEKPYFPNKPLNYILGVFLGTFWGLAVVFFMEYIDNTVKFPDDLKPLTDLHILGTVPASSDLKNCNIISNLSPRCPIVEAYRLVRNNIGYASACKPAKVVIAVTGCAPSEGRSSVAANLSIAYCMRGHTALAIDLNLRNPSLHRFFGTANDRGISNVLAGDLPLEEAIVKSDIQGLDVLPGGPLPADPSLLVESERLKDILTALSQRYETVIIDTPPVMALEDPVVIAGLADAVLFVIESSRVSLATVVEARQHLHKAGIELTGIVLNKCACRTWYREHGHARS